MRKKYGSAALMVLLIATGLAGQDRQRAAWNRPQKPFKVFGNTYWVGTRALGSVLVTSDAGHVLIDGALPESVPQIRDHIRELGFKIEDIKLILNTHVHYDHAGGIAELQRLSGASVAASGPTAAVLKTGEAGAGDPQFGGCRPIAPVPTVRVVRDGETLSVGPVRLTVHLTPGHTSGGTSWSWRSCEGARCVNLVHADSLSPVSNDSSRYTTSPLLKAFDQSYATLEALPCDILLTPHTGFSQVLENLAAREAGTTDAFIDPESCRSYVASMKENLKRRVESETR